MNRKMVFSLSGHILQFEAILLLLPVIVALVYGEHEVIGFLIAAAIAMVSGTLLCIIFKPKNSVIYAREGFLAVALAWVTLSAVGALPFVISGEIPSYIDAFFETVSGFTTTGASILTDVEKMSKCMLFWRSFTHWIGGMGILVFIMALIPNISDRSIHIMRAEMPGPVVGKLVPKVKDTAKILYLIYIGITALETIFLIFGGMSFYEALVHSLATAGTGGFGIVNTSIGAYSPYIQWVITAFMFLFGVNFNLYFLMLLRRFSPILRSTELWCYVSITLVCTLIITLNILPIYGGDVGTSVRLSAFQVVALSTTTGFSTADFNQWPELSKSILFLLMFVGGCAGSTAGGLKVSRVIMLFKMAAREIKRLLHPRSVSEIRIEGKRVDEQTIRSTGIYFALYMICIMLTFLLLGFDSFDIETRISAAVSCFNNIGPAFGAAGPASNYAGFSVFSKLVLSFAMLFGRLEIYPIMIALLPSAWSRK